LALLFSAGTAQAQDCLHGADETSSERARRLTALQIVREINAAQVRLDRERGTYVPLGQATAVGRIPLGFVFRVTFDQWGYAVSAKDTLDPCGFSFFSDQDGVVYEARPASDAATQDGPAPAAVVPEDSTT
jgi:hypothetical protein